MTTISTRGDYRVLYNGSTTYYVVDNCDQCYRTFSTEKGAIKHMNKVAEMAGQ